ncbi:hypothetical protein FACS189461_4490 [Spirochaetia bacterium]|nr:hypothetical protein FACS189461_4490 [Spirochaetia bacterium]
MAKQTNSVEGWYGLAERDLVVAEYLGLDISEADMRLVLAHTRTIKDFLAKEIPELFF